MAQRGNDEEAVNAGPSNLLQKNERSQQEAELEITEAPEEIVIGNDETQQAEQVHDEAHVLDTGFMANSQTRQLILCIVAFAVGVVGIALLVLKENLAMMVCGSLFFALGAMVIIAMAIWRCYDARRFSSIGIGYVIARTKSSCTRNAEQQAKDEDDDDQNSTA